MGKCEDAYDLRNDVPALWGLSSGFTIGSDSDRILPMSDYPMLHWLPEKPDWRDAFKAISVVEWSIEDAVKLANCRLDFVRTNMLDALVKKRFPAPPRDFAANPVRLAVLGSSTLAHLHSAIRIAGLRRGLWIDTYENDYGQYLQELLDQKSRLHEFKPTAVLFAFDAEHVSQGLLANLTQESADAELDDFIARITQVWELARAAFGCVILQQTVLNTFPSLLGSNEHRLPGSRHAFVKRLNERLRQAGDKARVDLIAIDDRIAQDGLSAWHSPLLWHRSKQEILPQAAPMWGDLVGRVLAAQRGKSYKVLVLDLDNTLWGGVIGDDGMDGIVLGQGSALGEGFAAIQKYAKDLSRRGIILAVASKNDEANALEPFTKHPEMILRRNDIASFRADWNDKAGNIRAIAADLNLGIDSLVFLDDNPFERALVRQELPMVAVPEVPDDPALIPQVLADAGYFEATTVTHEDLERGQQYQSNRAREQSKADATDIEGYLRNLEMRMIWRRFDSVGIQRTVQLINKTNQFNLTTRRYSEDEVLQVMNDPSSFGLQLRLIDRFGDNGVIAIVIGRKRQNSNDVTVDTWLMSCRVLGRQVEPTTLNLIVEHARLLGATRLIGEYIPTKKNGMVKDHYERLGFTVLDRDSEGGARSELDLTAFRLNETFIQVEEGEL